MGDGRRVGFVSIEVVLEVGVDARAIELVSVEGLAGAVDLTAG